MISNRLSAGLVVLSAAIVGCSGAEPKKLPTVTPEQKATQDKEHEEMKAKMQTPAK
jgi:hypothetical protein